MAKNYVHMIFDEALRVRITDKDRIYLKTQARANLTSVSEYVRRLIRRDRMEHQGQGGDKGRAA